MKPWVAEIHFGEALQRHLEPEWVKIFKSLLFLLGLL